MSCLPDPDHFPDPQPLDRETLHGIHTDHLLAPTACTTVMLKEGIYHMGMSWPGSLRPHVCQREGQEPCPGSQNPAWGPFGYQGGVLSPRRQEMWTERLRLRIAQPTGSQPGPGPCQVPESPPPVL